MALRTFQFELYVKGRNDTGRQFSITLDLDVPFGWDTFDRMKQEDWLYEKITDRLDVIDFTEITEVKD